MRNVAAVVLAAGLGTRMRSSLVKTMHPLRGRPMIAYTIDAAKDVEPARLVVVVGHQADRVKEALGEGIEFAFQEKQMGTGHAVMQAASVLGDFDGDVVVLYGDMPLLRAELIARLIDAHIACNNGATVLTAVFDDPSGYGRIVRDENGGFLRVVEHRDCSPTELRIREINTGVYCFMARALFEALARVLPANAQGEYYLTDALELIRSDGFHIGTVQADNPFDVMGINDRKQLALAEAILRERRLDSLLMSGVTMEDPSTVYVDDEAKIGPDTVIKPFTFIEGRTVVGEACTIGPSARLVDSIVGARCKIEFSVIEGSTLEDDVRVGPFSHIRPGTTLKTGARVGNFAEIKNSFIGEGSKVPHHSYVGDADVGSGVNLGAGCVTVNYDGKRKHRTTIEDGAFIGCNANLIAPVRVGKRAYIAAGSTVNQEVPDGALAIARARQENKRDWVARKSGEA